MQPEISKHLPAPVDPNWETFLSRLEKGHSFTISVKEHILNIYNAANALGLKLTHRDRGDYVRVWRVN